MTYIITEEEAFHDEPTESTLKAAQRTKRRLQKILDVQAAAMEAPPDDVHIYKLELVE